jgi:hypothetical protein
LIFLQVGGQFLFELFLFCVGGLLFGQGIELLGQHFHLLALHGLSAFEVFLQLLQLTF